MSKNTNNQVVIEHEKLEVSSEILRALAHPLRMRILAFIDRNERINVNRIYNTLQLEQSITSQHLRILRLAGVVSAEKKGKYMTYSINYDVVSKASNAVSNYVAVAS